MVDQAQRVKLASLSGDLPEVQKRFHLFARVHAQCMMADAHEQLIRAIAFEGTAKVEFFDLQGLGNMVWAFSILLVRQEPFLEAVAVVA